MIQDPVSYSLNFGSTATWVAFLLGVLIYIIGFFGGLRLNLPKMLVAVMIATAIAVVARPLVNRVHTFVASILGDQLAGFAVPLLWTVFVLGIGLSLYEAFTVTAKEAHPMK
ncbi:MAG: hypothetical protein ONB30_11550 [candidate division KSB1 bacterium]|nr:hypothetical protein [candidate division KSB1 bacterium]MDZ7295600.1 hypothetical protein [candidate division KSB1 bacterium]MDZ7339165.1 hypothetical protein [candidate division KSB1 bacterium]MDZ7378072.1 hypothetical protein [candidate division KSB1 bacterium]MDZ7385130.1 hypothetical protein [candidate division KSB1 bacterium]